MKDKINVEIWSYLISENKWATLYAANLFFENKEFKVEEIRIKINEIINEHFTQTNPKRDLSNEVNSHVTNSQNKSPNNMGWYENVVKNGEKIKGYKKLTPKGKSDLSKRILEIESKIKKTASIIKSDFRISKSALSISIVDLVTKIKSGSDARIPTFQREYVWKHKKVAPLLLSLIKDYPIGAMLFWRKNAEQESFVILDGLQRTFSLTLISNHPFAYIDYELYKYIINDVFEMDEEISQAAFDKYNNEWIKHFNDKTTLKKDKTFEKLLEIFNNHSQIKKTIEFILHKWIQIEKNFHIPYILLNEKYSPNETADIFNLINTQGVELNNFEVNSSIWSKTPIKIDEELIESDEIYIWRNAKYVRYREKIGVKGKKVAEENDDKTIEISDFIYSTFDKASKGKYIIRETFFKNDILKTSALEPMLTIFINFLKMGVEETGYLISDYKIAMSNIGKILSNKIKTKKDLNDFGIELEKYLKFVEEKLVLLKNSVNNSKINTSINIASSLLSLIINIVIKHGVTSEISSKILFIFIHEYFEGNYGSGSTNNAWKQLNTENYINYNSTTANNVIKKFISMKMDQDNKIETSYDPKFILILSLFNNKFISLQPKELLHVDHIIPKALFVFDKSDKAISKNYVHTFYNLQLIKEKINEDKKTKINPNIKKYYLAYNLKKHLGNEFQTYINEFERILNKIREEICNPMAKDTEICKKMPNPKYDSFFEFIELQKKYIGKLINENDLLD